MIKVIAFDLDDTLWDSRPVLINAERCLQDWLRCNVPHLAYGVGEMRALRADVLGEDPDLIHYITELRRRVIEKAMLLSGMDAGTADARSRAAMDIFLEARNRIDLSPATLDTVRTLSRRFILGSLTNGNADIANLGLADVFSFAFSAEDVGAAKPAPDLFYAALDHTGSNPDEMVYVGDDPVLDIDAANAIGLHTVQVKNPRREESGESQPDQAITDIVDLPSAIDRIHRPLR